MRKVFVPGTILLESGKLFPWPEECGADPHQSAALGNGGVKVTAHAHGEFGQRAPRAGGQLVADVPEIGKGAPGHGGVAGERGDGHQAIDLQVWLGEGEVEQACDVGGLDPEFGQILAGVDLQQHGQFAADFTGGPIEDTEPLSPMWAL